MQTPCTVTLRYFERHEALTIIGVMADEFPGYRSHTLMSQDPAVRKDEYVTSAKPHKLEEWLTILLGDMAPLPTAPHLSASWPCAVSRYGIMDCKR